MIDLSNYTEHETKFGDKKVQKVKVDNSTPLGNAYEKLTNKVVVEERPIIIEAPLNIKDGLKKEKIEIKKEEPKKEDRE